MSNKERINVRIEAQLYHKLVAAAKADRRTMTGQLEHILDEKLKGVALQLPVRQTEKVMVIGTNRIVNKRADDDRIIE